MATWLTINTEILPIQPYTTTNNTYYNIYYQYEPILKKVLLFNFLGIQKF